MEGIIGIIAVAGFWLVILVLILRRPILELMNTRLLGKASNAELQDLRMRITHLESEMVDMEKELLAVRDSNEFHIKLLKDNNSAAPKQIEKKEQKEVQN